MAKNKFTRWVKPVIRNSLVFLRYGNYHITPPPDCGVSTLVGGRVVSCTVGSTGGKVNCPVAVRRDMLGNEAEN